ncbi:unnamed protein product [Boreogadus saida]
MPYTGRVDEALEFLVVLLSHHRRQKGSDSRGDPNQLQKQEGLGLAIRYRHATEKVFMSKDHDVAAAFSPFIFLDPERSEVFLEFIRCPSLARREAVGLSKELREEPRGAEAVASSSAAPEQHHPDNTNMGPAYHASSR